MPGRQSFLCANPTSPLTRVRRPGFYSQCKKLRSLQVRRAIEACCCAKMTMCPGESLRFVTEAHRHLSPVCEASCASQPQRRSTAVAESHPMKACASQDGSQSAVALDVRHGSLARRGWLGSSTTVSELQLRQNYIMPHCPQCPPVSRKLLWWRPPLRALRVKARSRRGTMSPSMTLTSPGSTALLMAKKG